MSRTVESACVAGNDAAGVDGSFILIDGKFPWASCNDGGLDCENTPASLWYCVLLIRWTRCSDLDLALHGGYLLEGCGQSNGICIHWKRRLSHSWLFRLE